MDRIVVVGSGPSGVHFALTVLRKGYDVTMVDVGFPKPAPVAPEATFRALKDNLEDPVRYFLGEKFEGVVLPHPGREYYGLPPSKNYAVRTPPGFDQRAKGFAPFFGFAQGGIAEVWTGGCYPFNDAELADFPFGYAELGPCYGEVARRIGVCGAPDDLERHFPLHDNLLEPLELDPHSALLLAAYDKNKTKIQGELKCSVGRTRVAVLSRDLGNRKKCSYLGRCLWGCPTAAFYTPSLTLAECREFPNFRYVPGVRASHFRVDAGGRATHIVVEPIIGGNAEEIPADRLVLAAGALSSSQIYLESIYRHTGEVLELGGLMDNRQILVPFVNWKLVGQPYKAESYQYHQVGLGIEQGAPKEYVHGQVTTLKTAMLHPIIQNLPCDARLASFVVRNFHAALGIVNVNLHDTRRAENIVTLDVKTETGRPRLVIQYSPARGEEEGIRRAIGTVGKALRAMGCMVAPGMTHVRPMGASVHYAGMLPMSRTAGGHTVSETCESHAVKNLYVVDGATYPFLPAKNITFTLMANAVRVANAAF
jgi:choline dehydrogenase-like flavoprotein